jgi:hypothetical protein
MQPPPSNNNNPFDRISRYVREENMERYWQFLALVNKLPPEDDVCLLVEATGFLTLIVAEVPSQMAAERQALENVIETLAKRLEDVGQEVILAAVRSTHLLRRAQRIERNRLDQALRNDLAKIELKRQQLVSDQKAFLERIHDLLKKVAVIAGVTWVVTMVLIYFIVASRGH